MYPTLFRSLSFLQFHSAHFEWVKRQSQTGRKKDDGRESRHPEHFASITDLQENRGPSREPAPAENRIHHQVAVDNNPTSEIPATLGTSGIQGRHTRQIVWSTTAGYHRLPCVFANLHVSVSRQSRSHLDLRCVGHRRQ